MYNYRAISSVLWRRLLTALELAQMRTPLYELGSDGSTPLAFPDQD